MKSLIFSQQNLLTLQGYLRLIVSDVRAHPKLSCANFHASANHESVSRLENVEGAGHTREPHGADENGNRRGASFSDFAHKLL